MSRRREAAELARALAISTQEARTTINTRPSHIASSSTCRSTPKATQDSRDMELRVVTDPHHQDQRSSGSRSHVSESVSEHQRSSGSGQAGTFDPITNTTAASGQISAIQSFPNTTPRHIPNSSNILPSTSNSMHPPMIYDTSISASTHQSSPVNFPGHRQSSPANRMTPNGPIPSSRLGTTEPPDHSSSSSHRPLFSPTQTSTNQPEPIHPELDGPHPRYQRNPHMGNDGTATPPRQRFQVSSSPPEPVEHQSTRPTLPAVGENAGYSSDQEVEEQVEEVSSRSLKPSKSKTNLQVVLPSIAATKPKSTPSSPSPKQKSRHQSPDPLDSNLHREHVVPPPELAEGEESVIPIDPPRVTTSSAAMESQSSIAESAGGMRKSRRVQDITDRKEAEKEARRAKRRAEKEAKARKEEKERLRAEKKAAAEEKKLGTRTTLDLTGTVASSSRAERAESRSVRHTRRTSRSSPAPGAIDSSSISLPPTKSARASHRTAISNAGNPVPEEHTGAEMDNKETKRVREIEDDLESWQGTDEESKHPSKKAKETKKGKAKKPVKCLAKPEGPTETLSDSNEAEDKTVEVDMVDTGKVSATDEEQPGQTRQDLPVQQPETNVTKEEAKVTANTEEDQPEQLKSTEKVEEKSKSPTKSPSFTSRSPLKRASSNARLGSEESSYRASPGPRAVDGTYLKKDGIKWKTTRNDLGSVLSKFPGSRATGMSRRHKIAPLHMKIGPPVKALPPPPPKPSKKKAESDEEDEDEDEDGDYEEGENGEGPKRKSKVKGMEWYMVED